MNCNNLKLLKKTKKVYLFWWIFKLENEKNARETIEAKLENEMRSTHSRRSLHTKNYCEICQIQQNIYERCHLHRTGCEKSEIMSEFRENMRLD